MKRSTQHLLALLAVSVLASADLEAQTMTFTVQTTTSGGTAIQPRLVWNTTPVAASCIASGTDSNWAGEKTGSGAVTLTSIRETRSYTLVCNWPGNVTATVTCTAPTTHTDGTALTDLTGFRFDYGTSATTLDTAAYVTGPCRWVSPNLAPGTWYFAARAVKANGLESAPSAVASKVITAGATQSRTLEVAVRFPNPPTALTVE